MVMENPGKRFVVSLGGSIIAPDAIDTAFLESFKRVIEALVSEGYSFVIIPGGGATSRRYQAALRTLGVQEGRYLDSVGVSGVAANARLLQALFGLAQVVWDNGATLGEDSIVIAAGTKPGRSSDAGAVELAGAVGASCVINLSNIAYVYDADPRGNPQARPIADLTWERYRALIPREWDPGMSTPFDPIASAMATEAHLTVAILGGHDTDAFEHFVRTGVLKGTLIHP